MMIADSNFLLVMGMTAFAGLATGIGGAVAFFAKRTNARLLSASLGFSGGVMLYISFVELLAGAENSLREQFGGSRGAACAVLAFFGGILLAALIDRLIPAVENPHEAHGVEEIDTGALSVENRKKLGRSGVLFALAIGIHNFPEGLATFAAGMNSLELGVSIALAIAIHNVPEGIAVSVPLFYATGSREKAFFYSCLSGLAEPTGALAGYLILHPFLNETILQILFALVAGIMVFITFDELLPAAERYGEHHISLYGLIGGMLLMALVLSAV